MLTAILTDIAREAAISSFDAHGSCVPYRLAYDFIKSVLGDTDDDRYALLPEFAPIEFRMAYARFADCIENGQLPVCGADDNGLGTHEISH